MNDEPNDQYNEYEDEQLNNPSKRRKGWSVNLTGIGGRIAATVLAIGLGVVIIYYALSSPGNENETASLPQTTPTPTIDQSIPLATWTPSATSTPPPVEVPTLEPVPVVEEVVEDPNPTGGFVVGGQVKVTGTENSGVNMREGTGLTFAIVELLTDETVIEIIGGPTEADGYTWWQVRLADGQEGWLVQDFIAPVN